MTIEIKAGAELPGGSYALGAERHAKLVSALGGGSPEDGSAHPLSAWVIAMGGCGIGIGELFEAAGVPMEDGPMLGACEVELLRPLGIETPYTVSARIESLVEKSGRKLGRFDVMSIRMEVAEPSGELAATCTPSMILPRPGAMS
jgi:hypothetical protein